MRRATVGSEYKVEISVIIHVGVCSSPCDARAGELSAHSFRYLGELAVAKIVKKVRRFRIADPLLNVLDLIFDVTVCDENIEPAVEVIVKKEAAKTQS